MNETNLSKLTSKLVQFRDRRDWKQFHNPKDLAAALSIEAAELQELFLWKNSNDLEEILQGKREAIQHEVADIASFLLLLCHELEIDLEDAVQKKLELNEKKYPDEKVRGSSKKYSEY